MARWPNFSKLTKVKTDIVDGSKSLVAQDWATLTMQGVHEKRIKDIFEDKASFTGNEPFTKEPLYCLAFTNRSGSNLLAGYLRSTPVFGGFREQLIGDVVQKVCTQRKITTFPDYIQNLSAGRRYGFKTSIDQMLMLRRLNIHKMYGGGMKIIQMKRRDVVGQAISYQIALQTKAWSSQMSSDIPPEDINFDPAQITKMAENIRRAEYLTDLLVEAYDLERVEVIYEDLVATPRAVLGDVFALAGRRVMARKVKEPVFARQADEVNDRFRDMYRTYLLDQTNSF